MASHGKNAKCLQTLWLDNGRADIPPQASVYILWAPMYCFTYNCFISWAIQCFHVCK